MSIEKDLIIALLRLTKDGPISHELVNREARVPSENAGKLIERLQNDGLVYVRNGHIEADSFQRLKLAVRALSLGGDLEKVGSFLQWQEFEGMAAVALERNGYSVTGNLRFKHAGRKWEIDIVGCRKPLAICVDCKHWHRSMYASALKRIVEEQVERTKALVESLPSPTIKVECSKWDKARFIPVILSLMQGASRFHENVPVVSVLQLQDFVNQLSTHLDKLFQIKKANEERLHLGHDL